MKNLHHRTTQVFQTFSTSEPFLRIRYYMQIFCCIAQILWASSTTDPLLLVARSNHRPAPCFTRCFWHNLYDCLLSITFFILSQKAFWLNHNLLVLSCALLLIGPCSSKFKQCTRNLHLLCTSHWLYLCVTSMYWQYTDETCTYIHA
jgi:hypothetical protein